MCKLAGTGMNAQHMSRHNTETASKFVVQRKSATCQCQCQSGIFSVTKTAQTVAKSMIAEYGNII